MGGAGGGGFYSSVWPGERRNRVELAGGEKTRGGPGCGNEALVLAVWGCEIGERSPAGGQGGRYP